MSDFSTALVRERMRFQRSRDHVADQCGVSWAVVKRWEDAEAVPNRQQFKRLAGMFRRLVQSPPPWDWAAEVVPANALGLLGSQPESVRIAIPLEDQVDLVEPEPESFAQGLRRVREDNHVSQEELGQLMGLHGTAISAWEVDDVNPVQENLDKLFQLLPELRVACDLRKVRMPESRDIKKPQGNHQPRADLGVAMQMAMESSDREALLVPMPTIHRPSSREWMGGSEAHVQSEDTTSVDAAAQQLGRARLRMASAAKRVVELEAQLHDEQQLHREAELECRAADERLQQAIARSLEGS